MESLRRELNRELKDELLDEIMEAEARDEKMNKASGYVKPKHLDAVQLNIEKELLTEKGLSYGSVIDAINYVVKKPMFRHVNFEWEKWISEDEIKSLSNKVEDALLEAVSKYGINNKEISEILTAIKIRYINYCAYEERGRYGERGKKMWPKERIPYEVGWSPWFKELNERFMDKITDCLDTETYVERECKEVKKIFADINKDIKEKVIKDKEGKPLRGSDPFYSEGRDVTIEDGLDHLKYNEMVAIEKYGEERKIYGIRDIVEQAQEEARLISNCIVHEKNVKRKAKLEDEKRMYETVAKELSEILE